jgi:molecular chaperone DnaK
VGIPPAQRGVPQIEVTFDIDANGIVHVSAKDLGTGKEQKIRIESSSGLSDSDIDRMVKEAEVNAEADRREKEQAEVRNEADSMIYSSEKNLKDLGDKVNASDKAQVEAAVADLKKALEGGDLEGIKAKTEALKQATYKVAEEAYKQSGAQGGAPGADGAAGSGFGGTGFAGGDAGGAGFAGGAGGASDGGNTKPAEDADYEVVDK